MVAGAAKGWTGEIGIFQCPHILPGEFGPLSYYTGMPERQRPHAYGILAAFEE